MSDLSSLTMGTLALRVPIHSSENNYSIRDPTPSVKRMTAEEFHGMTDMEAFSRIPLAVGKVDLKVFRDNFIRALWEDEDPVTHEILNTKGKSPPLPRVKLLVIWGDMTIIDCVLAASAISKHVVAGHVQRRIEIEKIEGANHFVRVITDSFSVRRP